MEGAAGLRLETLLGQQLEELAKYLSIYLFDDAALIAM